MNWIELFESLDENASTSEPAKDFVVEQIKEQTGTEISGQLLELLMQTNGIINKRFGDYLVYSYDRIIECHELFNTHYPRDENELLQSLLFIADDGCGDYFGYVVSGGKIETEEIGVYYPITNEYKIVAPSLREWAIEWYSGKLVI